MQDNTPFIPSPEQVAEINRLAQQLLDLVCGGKPPPTPAEILLANARRFFDRMNHALAAGATIPPRPCWVYFARSRRGRIKIGISHNPEQRIRQLSSLQTDSPFPVTLLAARRYAHSGEAKEAEAIFHSDFEGSRVRGEWFEPTPALLELVELFRENPDGPLF